MRLATPAHAIFAATLIGLGIMGVIEGDFGPPWQPVSKSLPGRELLVYLCALIALGSGAGLLFQSAAAWAARVLLAFLLLWWLLFRVPVLLHAPAVAVSWEGCAETVVVIAAVWVLYACSAAASDREHLRFAIGERGLRIGRILFGLALIPLGIAHLAYPKETAALVPGWLPAHQTWVYLTGCTYIAAGVAIVTGVWARLAASLAAVQMAMFTLLVWVPVVAAGSHEPYQLSELIDSWLLTTGAWVVADSYRDALRLTVSNS